MRSTIENIQKYSRLLSKQKASYPEEIQLEVTNACNLKCPMCPHTLGTVPTHHFPIEDYYQVILNNPPPKRLVLTGWGEPLLHPQFFDMIHFTNQKWPTTKIRFTTNGTLLQEIQRSEILKLNISTITVSLDNLYSDGTKKRKQKNMLHPHSNRVVKNIIEYCQHPDLPQQTPLQIQCVLTLDNYDDIQEMIMLFQDLTLYGINVARLQSFHGFFAHRMDWEVEQTLLQKLIQFGRKNGVHVRSINIQPFWLQWATYYDRQCVKTDDSLYITIEGSCTPCCNLREYSLGQLQQNGFQLSSIWHNKKAFAFFHNQSPICGNCDALFYRYKQQDNS